MWPWTKREPTNYDLMRRIDHLETAWKDMQLEWASVADKLLHRIARQAKRDRDALAATAEPPEGGGTPMAPLVGKALLRARLAARNGGLGGVRE